jgi:hypothetical protein
VAEIATLARTSFRVWQIKFSFWTEKANQRGRSISIPDDCVRDRSVAFLERHAFHSPRVGRVKGTMNSFAFGDIDAGGMFVIQVLIEGRSTPPDTCFDVEGSHLKGELGTEELYNASARREIKSVSVYVSRKMSVKVTEDRIKVYFDQRILNRLVRNVLKLRPGLVASREHGRLATL